MLDEGVSDVIKSGGHAGARCFPSRSSGPPPAALLLPLRLLARLGKLDKSYRAPNGHVARESARAHGGALVGYRERDRSFGSVGHYAMHRCARCVISYRSPRRSIFRSIVTQDSAAERGGLLMASSSLATFLWLDLRTNSTHRLPSVTLVTFFLLSLAFFFFLHKLLSPLRRLTDARVSSWEAEFPPRENCFPLSRVT